MQWSGYEYWLACTGVITINYQNEQVLTIYFTKVVELYFKFMI